ncbi:MAG: aldehyde dehydrogenase family protein [Pseudomonadota bacterium]
MERREFFIGGAWVAPLVPNDYPVINPASEEQIGVISLGGAGDVDLAVKAAQAAAPILAATSFEQRLEWLHLLLEHTKRRYRELATIMSMEVGAPITMCLEQQMDAGIGHLESFIKAFHQIKWREELENGDVLLRTPIGVCAAITPWNWPINQIVLKIVPALATGSPVILKPSELTPLNAVIYAEMIDEAGFPKGSFNLVHGDGATVGTALAAHPDVRMVSFTGSIRGGVSVARNAADTIKRVTLELGGKSPNLVFADADLEARIRGGIDEVMNNSGQSCDAPTRMLVERSAYDNAVAIARDHITSVRCGDPALEGPHIGPLISAQHYQRVQDLISLGIAEGATLLAGGTGKPEGFERGYYTRPTIFIDVDSSMRIDREEIFGPVMSIAPFDSEDQAVRMANASPYGLAAYIQTSDMDRAWRVAAKLEAGNVHINGGAVQYGTPFGGFKQSGNGREGGLQGLEDFLELKAVHS